MGNRLKSRLILLCIWCVGMGVWAVAARPARPPVPARPAQQENAGPLSGRVILVDAGHGGHDGGARARDSGVWEKEINLRIAQALRDSLRQAGAAVIMTREEDMEYHRNKRKDLTARLDLARQGKADAVVSVHMNEYRSRRESGPQVFYRSGQEASRLLSGVLQEALIQDLHPRKERAAMAGDYFILSLDLPSVLVECGFLSNPEDEKLLLTPAYQQRIAHAITRGMEEFFLLSDRQISSNVP